MTITFNRILERLVVSGTGTTDALGPIGTFDRSLATIQRQILASSSEPKTLELFTRNLTGYGGIALLGFDRTLAPFVRSLTARPPAGALARQLRYFTRDGQGVSGGVGSLNRTLRPFDGSLSAYSAAIGQLDRSLGLLHHAMQGFSIVVVEHLAISMHTERQAFTAYTNYPFNSFAKFNGAYLAAGDGGVYVLTGDTDDGAEIDAVARVGINDFATSHLKKMDRLYLGYRSDGAMRLRVITDETNINDYAVPATGKTGITGNRVLIGKGLSARYWQFEIQNVAGSDFELNVVECVPHTLQRRVGG